MSTQVEKLENSAVSFEIAISAEEFEAAVEKAYRKNIGRMKVQGFRPGKAPRAIVEKMYGEGAFYDDAINIALPAAYDKTVEELELSPVDRPEIDVKEISKESGVVLTVKVTVKPEFTLAAYIGVKAKRPDTAVTKEDINTELSAMQNRNGRSITVTDRAVMDGDTANIDFEGFVDSVPFEGGKGEAFDLKIGSGQFIPGFEEQLIGASIGDTVEVKVDFPEEYHAENLAGKPALFKVTVNSITAVQLPELDDEFAKDVSEFDTLDELKADLSAKISERKEKSGKTELENQILETIAKDTKMEIPEVMINSQIDLLIRDFEMQMRYQGATLDAYLEYTGMSIEEMREQFKERAEGQVKTSLIIEAIGKAENIKPAEDEISAEYDRLAKLYNMEADKIRENIKEDDIADSLASSKTVEFLVENAKIK